MWSQLLKIASLSKGALVVGVATGATLVSNAEFSNTPSHEVPSATPAATATQPRVTTPVPSPSTVTTAGSLPHGEVPGVIKECVEKYLALREAGDSASNGDRESTGAVCKAALAISGLSGPDFWAKFGGESHSPAPKSEAPKVEAPRPPTSEFSPEVMHWIRECVTQYTNRPADATQTCIKAIQLTGLTSSQFAERFLKLTKPTTAPSTKPASAELEQLVYSCRKLQGAITDSSTSEQFNAASAICDKAIALSGLGTEDFWKKWPPLKLPAAPTATPKPATNTAELPQLVAKCLDLYKTITSTGGDTKAASDACRVAIQASGLSSADFWTKFHPTTN